MQREGKHIMIHSAAIGQQYRYFGSNAGIGQPFPLIDVILSQHYQAQQHVDMAAYVRHSYGPFL